MKTQDLQTIRKKIYQYCAFQERSENQVKVKLKTLGLEDELLIQTLIEELKKEKFIDNERFVKSYVRGKFRNCHWGKQKIFYELTLLGFSSKLIDIALQEIEEEEYFQTLKDLALKKLQSLHEDKDKYIKTEKYLYQKGYEMECIQKVLKEIDKDG